MVDAGMISETVLGNPLDSASASTFFFPGMCAILTSTLQAMIFEMIAWNMSLTFSDGLWEMKRSHTFEESEQTNIFRAPLSYP